MGICLLELINKVIKIRVKKYKLNGFIREIDGLDEKILFI
jgi:hypothetical protein